MKPILPSQEFGKLQEIRTLLKEERDARVIRKLTAIKLLMEGHLVKEVASILSVSRNTVTSWVKQWNHGGKEELKPKHKGSTSKVTPEVRAEIVEVIEKQAEIDGQVINYKVIHGYLKKKEDSN